VIAKRKGVIVRGAEGSGEQVREPMNKKRIGGLRCRASGPMIAKPIFIKDTGGKSDDCAW
jgi:hypothetical protein